MTETSETWQMLRRVHDIRRCRARLDATRAARDQETAQAALDRARLTLDHRRAEEANYAAAHLATIEAFVDFDAFFATLAMRGAVCRAARAAALEALDRSDAALRRADDEQDAARKTRRQTEARADMIEDLARQQRHHISRQAALNDEERAAEICAGRTFR